MGAGLLGPPWPGSLCSPARTGGWCGQDSTRRIGATRPHGASKMWGRVGDPQPCLTWPGPFLRPEHKVSWHFYFLFTAFCFRVLQQAGNSTDQSPWRSRPRAARIRPGFWERGAGAQSAAHDLADCTSELDFPSRKQVSPPPHPPSQQILWCFFVFSEGKCFCFYPLTSLKPVPPLRVGGEKNTHRRQRSTHVLTRHVVSF